MAGSTEYRVNIIIQSKDRSSQSTAKAAKGMDTLKKAAKLTAGAFVAFKTAQKAVDFAKFGASVDRQAKSLNALAKASGSSGKAIVSSMQTASDFTIDRMTAMQAANKAMLLDVAKTPAEFERLTKVATTLGRVMGQDAAKSIDDFVTAAGRQSKQIADNLGLMVGAEQANKRYAASLGITADQLDDAQKKQAFMTEMLRQGEIKMAAMGETSLDTAGKIEKVEAAIADLKADAAGAFAEMATEVNILGLTLDNLGDRLRGLPDTTRQLKMMAGAGAQFWLAMVKLENPLDAMNNSLRRQTALLDKSNPEIERYASAIKKVDAETSNAVSSIQFMDTATLDLVKSDGDLLNTILSANMAINAEKEALGLAESAIWSDVLATQSLQAAEEELRLATEAVTLSQLDLAAQLKDASSAQIAQAAIAQLKLQLDAGKITFDEYKTAVGETQLAFGLATPSSVALAKGIQDLAADLAAGKITAGQFNEQLAALKLSIDKIPTSKTIDIRVNVRRTGFSGSLAEAGIGEDVIPGAGTTPTGPTSSVGAGGPGFQRGGAFTVRRGFPHDTFPMRVSSGERVTVRPRVSNTENNFNMTVNTRATAPAVSGDFQMMSEMAG